MKEWIWERKIARLDNIPWFSPLNLDLTDTFEKMDGIESQTEHIERRIKYIYEEIGKLELSKQKLYDELNEVMDMKANIHNDNRTPNGCKFIVNKK